MFSSIPANDDLSQGDIISEVPLAYVTSLRSPQIFDSSGAPVDTPGPIGVEHRLGVYAQVVRTTVMIVSQSCDVLSKPFILAARVLPLSEFDTEYQRKTSEASRAKHLRENYQKPAVRPTVFYLQEAESFPKSVANLIELHTVLRNSENVDYMKSKRILRLTPEALQDFQFRLEYFFGRFACTTDYMLTEAEKSALQ